MKKEGKENDLLKLIAESDKFNLSEEELLKKMDPAVYTGRSARQVEVYLRDFVKPVLEENKDSLGVSADIRV